MLPIVTDAGGSAARPSTGSESGLDATAQKRLVAALLAGNVLGAEHAPLTLLETHISYVFLTGTFAYKVKKAIELGFLDFRSLSSRHFFCQEELRLNRRSAPQLYLDVVPITGELDAPAIGGEGPILDYAVKMREFPQQALASQALARGELSPAQIDELATDVAAFHRAIGVATLGGGFGAPEAILHIALQNFAQIRPLAGSTEVVSVLDGLEQWTMREHAARAATMLRRREEGFVRECHGDLHLGNIALIDGRLTIFDCVEFNQQMRWIDVMSEIAFAVMDLEDRGRADLARRFLNAYLEITGDYEGLSVLRFYLVYRAMVRAKIAVLRSAQLGTTELQAAARAECAGYIALARRYAQPPRPAIVITHGVSGCGKTTLSQALLELTAAVRVRTDVERKRALRVESAKGVKQGIDGGLYSPQATEKTYAVVLGFARAAATAGYLTIVDGAFLKRWQRDMFRRLAAELRVPFAIVAFAASEATMRARVEQRQRVGIDVSDADLAVLEHQLHSREPLAVAEAVDVCAYDAETPLAEARSPASWRPLVQKLGLGDLPLAESVRLLSSR
jgi:aminoglycoside phosphotransferase family enzyme/predicted kinase